MFYLNLFKCDLHKWHQPTNSSKLNKWLREASQNNFFHHIFPTHNLLCVIVLSVVLFFCVMQTSMLSLLFDLECWCGPIGRVSARGNISSLSLCFLSYSMDRAFVSFRKQLITLQEFKSSRHARVYMIQWCRITCWLWMHLTYWPPPLFWSFVPIERPSRSESQFVIEVRWDSMSHIKHFSFQLSLSSASRWWSFSLHFAHFQLLYGSLCDFHP